MALNFPDPATQTPVDTFSPTSTPDASTNGITYLWDGTKWNAQTNGDAAFWQRVGTTLSPATAGDSISTTGDISSADVTASSEVKAPSLLNAATTGDPNITLNADGSTLIRDLQNTSFNLVINGAMRVAQRNTSSDTSGYGSVDRFDNQYSGGTVTGSQETLNSSDTGPWEEGLRNYMRQTNTAVVASQSTSYRYFRYFIESRDVAGSGWECANASSNITISFWVRASVAQEYYFYIRNDDGTRKHYCFSTGSLTADTWTFVTKTIPGTAGLEFDNDDGRGLELALAGYWGTDFTDSTVALETWGDWDGTARTPDYTNTWGNTVDATLDLTGVQVTVTDAPVEFQHEDYGTTLAKCQRYYVDAGRVFAYVYRDPSTTRILSREINMRAAPSSSITNVTGGPFSVGSSSSSTFWYATTSTATAGSGAYATVGLNAEL